VASAPGRSKSHARSTTLSSEPSEDSPIRHLEFHTPYLRPAPTFTRTQTDPEFVSDDGLISAAVLANRARRPAQGLTEDWIRQHTGGETGESNNWLSDGSGDSEHSSLSGSISGEGAYLDDPRTPTLKRIQESRSGKVTGLKKQLSTETLRQTQFSASFKMAANELIGEIADLNLDEKGPPLPPKESLPWRAAALPATQEAPNVQPKDSSLAIPATDDATPPVEPRLKKKIQWKGKNILVLLPLNDGRGKQGKAPNPMSEKEVATMLREWEQLGYDTTGFNLGRSYTQDDEGSEGQSRSPWPYSIDTSQERQQRAFKVSIPDRRGTCIIYVFSALTNLNRMGQLC
jgi:hypothetical protein